MRSERAGPALPRPSSGPRPRPTRPSDHAPVRGVGLPIGQPRGERRGAACPGLKTLRPRLRRGALDWQAAVAVRLRLQVSSRPPPAASRGPGLSEQGRPQSGSGPAGTWPCLVHTTPRPGEQSPGPPSAVTALTLLPAGAQGIFSGPWRPLRAPRLRKRAPYSFISAWACPGVGTRLRRLGPSTSFLRV